LLLRGGETRGACLLPHARSWLKAAAIFFSPTFSTRSFHFRPILHWPPASETLFPQWMVGRGCWIFLFLICVKCLPSTFATTQCSCRWPVKNGTKMKKSGSRKSVKNGGCFQLWSCTWEQKVKSAMKPSCRCKDCKLNNGYSMFGNAEEGLHFYKVQRPYVEASDDVFLDRSLCLFQVSLANHSWVSFVGFAESYTEVVRNMPSGFQRLPAELQQVVTKESVNRLDRKMVSSAFYWHEIECEIMERNLDWYFKGKLEDARDEFMKFIESKRRTENYAHPVKDCSQMCKERGIVISTN